MPTKGGLGRRVVGPPGQRWDVAVTLQPTADIGVVTAHYARHGYHTEFEMPMPQLISDIPAEDTDRFFYIVNRQPTPAGSTEVPVYARRANTNFPHPPTITLLAGTFVCFCETTRRNPNFSALKTKMHVVTEDVTIEAETQTNVKIFPAVPVTLGSFDYMTWHPMLTCRYAQGASAPTTTRNGLGQYLLQVEEVI